MAEAWKQHQSRPKQRPFSDDNGAGTLWFNHGGVDYAALVLPFPEDFGSDWNLLLVAPEEDLLGDVKRSLQENMVMTVIILLLFLFILYLLFGRRREEIKP